MQPQDPIPNLRTTTNINHRNSIPKFRVIRRPLHKASIRINTTIKTIPNPSPQHHPQYTIGRFPNQNSTRNMEGLRIMRLVDRARLITNRTYPTMLLADSSLRPKSNNRAKFTRTSPRRLSRTIITRRPRLININISPNSRKTNNTRAINTDNNLTTSPTYTHVEIRQRLTRIRLRISTNLTKPRVLKPMSNYNTISPNP